MILINLEKEPEMKMRISRELWDRTIDFSIVRDEKSREDPTLEIPCDVLREKPQRIS